MIRNFNIKGFKENTWINGIGDLFCRKDGVRWDVNLSTYPRQEGGKDIISLSNAPILVRKSIINPTREHYPRTNKKTLTITTTNDWLIDRLGNCPALERHLPKEAKQYCFVFHVADGTRIYLPQFELARVLFFHNSYLSRSSVVHDVLNNEFLVDNNGEDGKGTIYVLDTCNCPVEQFNHYGFRRVLAWLLMDADARRSYSSISNYKLVKGFDAGQYRKWTFQFVPPSLEGVRLNVEGHFDYQSRTLLVYEITSISNIPINLPEHIEFYSPKFSTQVNRLGQDPKSGSDIPAGYNVDEFAEGSRENKPVMIGDNMLKFEFDRAVQTSKISKKRRSTGRGRKDADEPSGESCEVSTEEQGPNGDLPSAEWDNLEEQTDDAYMYIGKFSSYFKMLKQLEEKYGCRVINYPLRKLPKIKKCNKHVLETDSNPRCLAITHVAVREVSYYLLEVDTSDTKKSLSTKVIVASVIGEIDTHLCEIETRLLKGSLSWPKDYLDDLVSTDNHFGVPHQKSYMDGVLTFDEISKWADRMHLWLHK